MTFIEKLIASLALWIMSVISYMGYWGVMVLMAIESACIPLPSEIIMPFAGFLAFKGELSFWGVALAGAVGGVLGSIPAYYWGAYGGRRWLEKYGYYLLIFPKDLTWADKLFAKHGDIIVFIARLLPAIRTFIAFPAGVARMNMPKFIIYTFVGTWIWCALLAYLGLKLGENWQTLKAYFHESHLLLTITVGAFLVWYVRRGLKDIKHYRNSNKKEISNKKVCKSVEDKNFWRP